MWVLFKKILLFVNFLFFFPGGRLSCLLIIFGRRYIYWFPILSFMARRWPETWG